ncbi:MAG: hypothetical protein ABSH03_08510, partial [Candidatus Lustribacter sp.]
MTEDLHVAVDARFGVLDQRGIGRYTRAVSAQLLAQPGVTLSFVAPGLLAPRPRIARALGVDPKTVTAAIPAAAQVLWSPSNGTDLPTALPCVTTVHDVGDLGGSLPGSPVAAAIAAAVEGGSAPDAILFPASYDGRDIAGRLSVRLDRPVLTNVVDLNEGDGGLVSTHAIFGGSQMATARFT